MPLLWMEDSKKRDNFTGYAFYIFSHIGAVVETEIIPLDSSVSFISIPTVKMFSLF